MFTQSLPRRRWADDPLWDHPSAAERVFSYLSQNKLYMLAFTVVNLVLQGVQFELWDRFHGCFPIDTYYVLAMPWAALMLYGIFDDSSAKINNPPSFLVPMWCFAIQFSLDVTYSRWLFLGPHLLFFVGAAASYVVLICLDLADRSNVYRHVGAAYWLATVDIRTTMSWRFSNLERAILLAIKFRFEESWDQLKGAFECKEMAAYRFRTVYAPLNYAFPIVDRDPSDLIAEKAIRAVQAALTKTVLALLWPFALVAVAIVSILSTIACAVGTYVWGLVLLEIQDLTESISTLSYIALACLVRSIRQMPEIVFVYTTSLMACGQKLGEVVGAAASRKAKIIWSNVKVRSTMRNATAEGVLFSVLLWATNGVFVLPVGIFTSSVYSARWSSVANRIRANIKRVNGLRDDLRFSQAGIWLLTGYFIVKTLVNDFKSAITAFSAVVRSIRDLPALISKIPAAIGAEISTQSVLLSARILKSMLAARDAMSAVRDDFIKDAIRTIRTFLAICAIFAGPAIELFIWSAEETYAGIAPYLEEEYRFAQRSLATLALFLVACVKTNPEFGNLLWRCAQVGMLAGSQWYFISKIPGFEASALRMTAAFMPLCWAVVGLTLDVSREDFWWTKHVVRNVWTEVDGVEDQTLERLWVDKTPLAGFHHLLFVLVIGAIALYFATPAGPSIDIPETAQSPEVAPSPEPAATETATPDADEEMREAYRTWWKFEEWMQTDEARDLMSQLSPEEEEFEESAPAMGKGKGREVVVEEEVWEQWPAEESEESEWEQWPAGTFEDVEVWEQWPAGTFEV